MEQTMDSPAGTRTKQSHHTARTELRRSSRNRLSESTVHDVLDSKLNCCSPLCAITPYVHT